MSAVDRQYRALLRLLFDVRLRRQLARDPDAALAELGLSRAEAAPLRAIDPRGLELDAAMRRRYLMATLCRAYPLSSAALGAVPGGAEALAAFLATPALVAPLGERTRAFGDHLTELLEANAARLPAVACGLIAAFLSLERGRAANAAAIRAAIEAGAPPPTRATYSSSSIKRSKLGLPPFFLAAELPVPSSVMKNALDQAGPDNAWSLIEAGGLSIERVISVARGDEVPVTALCRGIATGHTSERAGAGGVAPLVDVSHLYLELAGRCGELLSIFDGSHKLTDLPAPGRRLAKSLLDGGFLQLV
jgi:hypothetical protein